MIDTWKLIQPDLPVVAALVNAKTVGEGQQAIDQAIARMDGWPRKPPVTVLVPLKAQLVAARADPMRLVVKDDPDARVTVVLGQKFADAAVEAAKGAYQEAAQRRALAEALVYSFAIGPTGVAFAVAELQKAAGPAWDAAADALGRGAERVLVWGGVVLAAVVVVGLVLRRT